ncbi:PTS sugar transporter subunit IIB [Clostridium uliginosum]|uniref:PTS system, cellobiose-specific IIB component n=1 Tax=Clostridium uliginosum TaxID=119641 RepID=A0A1I1N871_9CLOT|nr:PTS sugar transporter subunit IIB [Clostridium uliginosum]SFC93819.1 PTS system, cellobiose-specific IIB component [Clostridium uliginosum]
MKNIFLFCDAGMSTSLLVSKMRNVAEAHNVEVQIQALPFAKSFEIIENGQADCILLGPQVKFLLKDIEGKCKEKNIPLDVINSAHYGTMNGEKVLKQAIKMIRENQNK